jgi:hypothetical protein
MPSQLYSQPFGMPLSLHTMVMMDNSIFGSHVGGKEASFLLDEEGVI